METSHYKNRYGRSDYKIEQEVAVKEYLSPKVKDLEVELETTKEKYKENLQQDLSLEKERITKMQWDMEELRRKSLEMELKLKTQEFQDGKLHSDSITTIPENVKLLRELEATKDQLSILLKQHEELEIKSKSDIKILVKEVKSLRKSETKLKQKLDLSFLEKSEVEQLLQQEQQRNEHNLAAKRSLLHDCQTLQSRLQECNNQFVNSNFAANSSSASDVSDLWAESDKQMYFLLAESSELVPEVNSISNSVETTMLNHNLRLVLREIFSDSTKLRKQVKFFDSVCSSKR